MFYALGSKSTRLSKSPRTSLESRFTPYAPFGHLQRVVSFSRLNQLVSRRISVPIVEVDVPR